MNIVESNEPDEHALPGREPVVVEGDFGPVTMTVDRAIAGILRVHLHGRGGDADAALRRWRYNIALAREAGLQCILVVMELTGAVISESGLSTMIDKVADLHVSDLRVAIVQTRHERERQDELGMLIAMERGIAVRIFADETSALVWLRHGSL